MNQPMNVVRRVVLTVALTVGSVGASHAEPVVIAHPDIGADTLSSSDLGRVFLGSSSKVGGTRVVLAIQQDGATHESFVRELLSKSPQQFTSHWRKVVFSGKGKMPDAFGDDGDVLSFVASTPGAIGYVDSASVTPTVKTITIN